MTETLPRPTWPGLGPPAAAGTTATSCLTTGETPAARHGQPARCGSCDISSPPVTAPASPTTPGGCGLSPGQETSRVRGPRWTCSAGETREPGPASTTRESAVACTATTRPTGAVSPTDPPWRALTAAPTNSAEQGCAELEPPANLSVSVRTPAGGRAVSPATRSSPGTPPPTV